MARIVISILLLNIALLTSCGGGSAATQPPPPKQQQAYLPLAMGNTWNYDCGSGVTITDTVTQQVTVNGQTTFALQLQFPNAATQTFLLANDAQENTTFYGYLVNGAPVDVKTTIHVVYTLAK